MRPILSPFVFAAVIGSPALAGVEACPISADFIVEPKVFDTVGQFNSKKVESTVTRAVVDRGVVQIDCVLAPATEVYPGQDEPTMLENYLQFWSMTPTGPAYWDGSNFGISGTKVIQGIEVTYTYRLFLFAESFALVGTGVISGEKPSDVERFLNSVEVTSASSGLFPGDAAAAGRRSHIAACLPAVRADNDARELGLSEVEITYFCSCTGQRYFAEFTQLEFEALLEGDEALEQRRLVIQTECFDEATR